MTRLVSVIAHGEKEGWGAHTPQIPDLVIAEATEAELLASLPGTIAWCFEGDRIDDDFAIEIHVEREVARSVFVRVARDDKRAAREAVADRIVAALADPELGARLRAAPANMFGEVVYICALPTDTRPWLDNQVEEVRGSVNVVVPVSGTVLWVRAYGGQPAALPSEAGHQGLAATFAEATHTPDRQRILVPA
jgi:hypothetical protein